MVEPEESAYSMKWLSKQVSTATDSCHRSKTHERSNRETDGSGVFCGIRLEAIYREGRQTESDVVRLMPLGGDMGSGRVPY
jgi:hypothetical protein